MGNRLLRDPASELGLHQQFGFFDDFEWYITAHRWTSVVTDTGSITIGDAKGGVATLNPSDGTVANNDEAYLKTANEIFLFAAGKPMIFEAGIQFTEGNTDDVNIAMGFMSAVAANSILDDGGGPAASYSGAVFYKVDGGTLWNVEKSIAGTQVSAELSATNSLNKVAQTAGGAAYQTLRIEVHPHQGLTMDIDFYINEIHVYRIKDTTYASATEMNAFFGIKNGADTTAEALLVDWANVWQLR